jgi:hypothetical protein
MEYAEWQVTHWPHSAASAVSAQNVVIPTRHPILPALTRSLRSASVILTSPPQQDKRARSGSLQLHSAQTLGGGLIFKHWGETRNPPGPTNTARFPVSPQTPFPASPKTPRYRPALMTRGRRKQNQGLQHASASVTGTAVFLTSLRTLIMASTSEASRKMMSGSPARLKGGSYSSPTSR